ncbi:uncharacterized protein LOC143296310 isoform X1 [Babylonia areolata]|uniref:uncharacterized protein LOC143296310 isoform X1 n=1 Tax=Babylonia areolata TaxID=304850 RepID=UPI003FD14975
MDDDKASRFISSLVKSIQALCNGFVEFSNSIEVVGHIHLNIDRNLKLDYVLTEEVSKSVSEGSTVFSSHSYHSQPPPSLTSKSANDTSNSSQKSRKNNEADPLGLSALPREVPNTSRSEGHSHSSNRVSESSNSSHSFSRNSDSESLKHENNRSSCQIEDSSNKRRKMGPLSQNSPSPAAKRSRPNDFSSGSRTVIKEQGFEVIEIKEEPEEEPAVFFGNSATGQDIQTPDFSNVVMESLDRVNQIEGSDLVADGGGGDGMGGPQQPVFPVMFHQSDGMQSSSGGPVPGPSSDPQSAASTSGDAPQENVAVAVDEDQPLTSPTSSTGMQPTTTTTPTPVGPPPTTSSSSPVAPTLSVPSVTTFNITPRPNVSIPPMSPKFKTEDLPPDTKPEDRARLTERHILERVPPTEKKKHPSKRCKVCLRRSGYSRGGPARKHPKESVYYCPQCPSKPGLCCYPCYYVYHSKLNYWEGDEAEEGDTGGGGGGLRGGRFMDDGGSGGFLGRDLDLASTSGYGYSQAAHVIGQAMQMDSGGLYGAGVIDVDTDQDHKFCPLPVYGESLYGPGGQ